MRVALARILLMRPDAMLLDEPTNHLDLESLIWLEGFLKGYEGALLHDLARSRVHEPHRRPDHRDRRRRAHQLLGQLRLLRAAARAERGAGRGGVRAPAGDARQGDALHRALQGAGGQGVAGAVARQEARQDREGRAAQAAQDAGRSSSRRAALGRRRRQARAACASATARASSTTASTSFIRRRERWASWASTAPASRRCSSSSRARPRPTQAPSTSAPSVKLGYFAQHAMEVLDPPKTRLRDRSRRRFRWPASARCATLAGCFGFSGDDIDKSCRVLSGGEKARLVLARMLYDPPNFLVLDEPTNHLDMATKDMLVRALGDYDGTMLFVSHDRQFLAQLSNRVLELGPDGARRLRRRLPRVRRRAAATKRPACAELRSTRRAGADRRHSRWPSRRAPGAAYRARRAAAPAFRG